MVVLKTLGEMMSTLQDKDKHKRGGVGPAGEGRCISEEQSKARARVLYVGCADEAGGDNIRCEHEEQQRPATEAVGDGAADDLSDEADLRAQKERVVHVRETGYPLGQSGYATRLLKRLAAQKGRRSFKVERKLETCAVQLVRHTLSPQEGCCRRGRRPPSSTTYVTR